MQKHHSCLDVGGMKPVHRKTHERGAVQTLNCNVLLDPFLKAGGISIYTSSLEAKDIGQEQLPEG